MATFSHPNYTLSGGDKIIRNTGAPPLTAAEDGEVLAELVRYVEVKIIQDFNFVSIQIPEDEESSTTVLASPNWMNATKILMIVQNSYGSQLGIFSRSICFDQGISKGTWLPYIHQAHEAGYAVLLLRPNTNSVTVGASKMPIKGSESPEIHALNVWENIVQQAESAKHIALLGYGNGASLCKDIYLREMVRTQGPEDNRIKAFVAIEASSIVTKDDSADVRDALGAIAINLECNAAARGTRLAYRRDALGCTSLSLGMPPGMLNVAEGVALALEPVFKYFATESAGQLAKSFSYAYARDHGMDPTTSVVLTNPNSEPTPLPPGSSNLMASTPPAPGFLSRMFGSSKKAPDAKPGEEKLTVTDFDLLKVNTVTTQPYYTTIYYHLTY
ncbi:hypothetical protein B484DRAFT_407484 [Ochromonadaceae sp. CCMP2298]|nr:hypothetical protein B484DRAFT_407484 [Ochromonadaceae sp. CCMP2298]